MSPTATPWPYPRAIAAIPDLAVDVLECSIAPVAVEPIAHARPRRWRIRWKWTALHDVDVEPAVVVKVKKPHAAAGGDRWNQPVLGPRPVLVHELELRGSPRRR